MLTQVKNVRFWMQAKLGQRGAEMVEYAIVLACIAAVGVAFYSYDNAGTGVAQNGLSGVLSKLWDKVATNAGVSTGGNGGSTPQG